MELSEDEKLHYIDHILTKEFLPHIGTDPVHCTKKGYFLCLMIRRLLMVHVGLRPFDDRDHLQNKRYYFAGPMIAQIFFRSVSCQLPSTFLWSEVLKYFIDLRVILYFRALRIMHSDMRRHLELQMGRGKIFSMDRAINATLVSRFMSHCISTGIWGDKRRLGSHIYKSVTQVWF